MAWVLMFLSWYTISWMNVTPSAVGHREGDEVRWLPRRKETQTCAREGTLDFSLQIKGSCFLRVTILACALLTGLVTEVRSVRRHRAAVQPTWLRCASSTRHARKQGLQEGHKGLLTAPTQQLRATLCVCLSATPPPPYRSFDHRS